MQNVRGQLEPNLGTIDKSFNKSIDRKTDDVHIYIINLKLQ